MNAGIEKALEIAISAHKGQKDKAGKPYIFHPVIVASRMETEEGIMAALLHDVVEDSDITIEDIRAAGFPDSVVEAVRALTHADGEDYFDYIRTVQGNDLAVRVKIQDLNHNSDLSRLEVITEKDRKRAEKYKVALCMLAGK